MFPPIARPRWSRDGGELFFSGPEGLMAVGVSPSDSELRLGAPQVLFTPEEDNWVLGALYDVTPDGRFVMVRRGEGSTVTIVLNWLEELKAMGHGGKE